MACFFPKLKFWWPDIDWCYKTLSRTFTVVSFLLRKYATSCCTRSQFKVAPSFWFLNINVPIFLLKPCSNGLRKTWFKFLGTLPSKCWPSSMRVLVCIAIGKSGFLKKNLSKWPVTPTFFSVSLFSSTCSCGRVKKIEVFMFKIPDFSLAPRLCKQAGLDLIPAWKDLDPRTLGIGRPYAIFAWLCAALRIAPEPP